MQYKKYNSYKNSGVEWIGEIPEEWEIAKLKHTIDYFISGGTPNSDNEKFWSEDEKGISWVTIADMTNNNFIKDTKKRITLEGLISKNLKVLPKGTLIYSIFASLGKVSILKIPAATNQAILGLLINEKINNNFLKYYLNFLESPIIALSNANTQNNLNSTIIKNTKISLPKNLEKQKQIANFLDKKTLAIDKAIEKNKKLIELLEEKRISLINHTVTKGLDPNAKMKDSRVEWIREIPENWEIKRMKFNAKINPSKKKTVQDIDTKINFLPMEKVFEDGTYDENSKTKYYKISKGFTYFEDNDVLLAKITPCFENGKGTLVNNLDYGFGFGTTEFHVIRNNVNVNSKFLHYFSRSHLFRVTGEAFMEGSAGQKRVPTDFVKDYYMPTPNYDEQKQIANFLDEKTLAIDKGIEKNKKLIELLEEYKKSLIHHVVTGKVNVLEV